MKKFKVKKDFHIPGDKNYLKDTVRQIDGDLVPTLISRDLIYPEEVKEEEPEEEKEVKKKKITKSNK